MILKNIIFLVICLLIFNTYSRQYEVQCTTNSKCSDTQLLVTYTSLTTQQSINACVEKNGNIGCSAQKTQYKVQLCVNDYLGNSCKSGLCVLEEGSAPTPTPTVLESCAPQKYISYDSECPPIVLSQPPQTITCADCKQSTCTGNVKCITTTSPQQEFCFTQTTCPMSSIKVKFGACTNGKDSFDISCKCCVIEQKDVSLANTQEIQQCTVQNQIFKVKQFQDFYYAGDVVEGGNDDENSDKEGQNWQRIGIKIGVMGLGLLLIGLS